MTTSQLQRLCDRKNVRIKCTYGETDPKSCFDPDDTWVRSAHPYKCVLRYDHKKATFWMLVGFAHTDEPSAADVLACACSDSQALDMSFEDWCKEFGYDTDSRRAEKTYRRSRQLGAKVRRLLGSDFALFANAEH